MTGKLQIAADDSSAVSLERQLTAMVIAGSFSGLLAKGGQQEEEEEEEEERQREQKKVRS